MAETLAALQVKAAAAARLKELEQEAWFRAHPHAWMQAEVQLLDPLDPERPIKPYPDFPYLGVLVQEWDTHRRSITKKPRRMVISWTAIARAVHKALFLPHQRIFFIARKLGENDTEGARELLWRAAFILRNLRSGEPRGVAIEKLRIEFPNGSVISAVSSEPNQMRQVAATLVIGDEFAFWDKPEESLAALLPTLEGRGQFIGISTVAPGLFQRLVYDVADEDLALERVGEAPPATPDTFPGFDPTWLQAWTNPGNGFRIVDLRLGAHPAYRGPLEEVRRLVGNPPQAVWEQEYLGRIVLRGGTPVYGREFDERRMVVDHLPVLPYEPLLIGLDFGRVHPAAVVAQLKDGLQWRVYRCLQGDNLSTKQFVQQLLARMQLWLPEHHGERLWCGDISGNRDRGEDSAFLVLKRDFGIVCRGRATVNKGFQASIEQVRNVMQQNVGTEPALLIARNPETVILREGLLHGYRYPRPTPANPNPEEPYKDGWYDHQQDAFRYLIWNFGGRNRSHLRIAEATAASRRDIIPPRRLAW